MNPLNPQARDLLAQSKLADGPVPGSQAQIYRTLTTSAIVAGASLGVTAAEASMSNAWVANAATYRIFSLLTTGKLGFFSAVAVGLVGGSLVIAGVSHFVPANTALKPAAVKAVSSFTKGVTVPQPPPNAPLTPRPPEQPVEVETSKTTLATVLQNPSLITEETRLLAQVQQALREENGPLALKLLGRYRRDFGQGALVEEASAAEVFARCAVGDVSSARKTRAQFHRQFKGSPLELRVDASCAKDENADAHPLGD